jgi:hypothetical protein
MFDTDGRKLTPGVCIRCGAQFHARLHDILYRNRNFFSLTCSQSGQFNRNYKGGGRSAYEQKRLAIARYPERHRCRKRFEYAVATGKIVREQCCLSGSDTAHGHHWDYDKPYDVFWLSREHHNDVHKLRITLTLPSKPVLPPV